MQYKQRFAFVVLIIVNPVEKITTTWGYIRNK